MFLVSGVVPFFRNMACFVINNIVRLSKFFLFWWFFLPFNFPSYPFSPSYGLGLGVRGGPPWCLPFGSSLASFVFADPFYFAMGSVDYF
jgi:hypothetical protein